MYAKATLAMSQRHGELQFVTSHFQSLQGLRSAPCWLLFLVLTGIAASGMLPSRDLVLASLGIAVLNFGVYFAVGHWYSRSFGVVKRPDAAIPSGLISIMNPEARPRAVQNYAKPYFDVILMIWILEISPSLFRSVDRDSGMFCLIAVAYALLPRVMYSASEVGLIRLRRYAAGAGALILGSAYLSLLHSQNGRWQLLTLLFAILLSLDLYDHWLLSRLLSGPAVGATHV